MRETEKIWMNGELVDWDDARIHVGAHGLHYGSGCSRASARTRRRRAPPSSG
jgi:branched-subunit amino acid aminotransferase/4-amino-4-deoxychorismate lyase